MSADGGGLANFDEDAALANLANVGQGVGPPVDAVSGGAAPDVTPPAPVSQTPGNELAEMAPESPAPAQPGGVDVYNLGNPHDLEPLGDVPQPPALTGNQAQDVQNNIAYSRQLSEYQNRLQQHKAQIDAAKQAVSDKAVEKQAAAQKEAIAQRAAFQAAQQKRLAQRQAEIDQAVNDRAAAAKDLEAHDKVNGGQIVALIAGAFGAALQNYGSALRGGPADHQNQAALAINAINQRDYEKKKARLQASSEALREARYGYKDDADNMRAGLNDIDADYAAKQKLIQLEAEAQGRKAGIPAAELANNAIILQARQNQLAAEQKIHEREEELEQKRQQAAATNKLAEAHLQQGERQIAATQGYHNAELGLRASEGAANRAERRFEHEIALADRIDKKNERQAAAKEKEDEKLKELIVRDASGREVGYAHNARVAKATEDRMVQYDDSIEALEDLLAYRRAHNVIGRVPLGDRYDRAVLAVAATTQANASDRTTAHEAGTVKGYGLLSDDAIERTLAHQKKRQAAFMKQIRPLEGSDSEGRVSLPPVGDKGQAAPASQIPVGSTSTSGGKPIVWNGTKWELVKK